MQLLAQQKQKAQIHKRCSSSLQIKQPKRPDAEGVTKESNIEDILALLDRVRVSDEDSKQLLKVVRKTVEAKFSQLEAEVAGMQRISNQTQQNHISEISRQSQIIQKQAQEIKHLKS